MKTRLILAAAFACILACSCNKPKTLFMDFNDIEGLDQSLFTVTSTKSSELSEDMLPESTKVTSVGAVIAAQKIFENLYTNSVLELVGTYKSVDHHYRPITLSGKVIIPLGVEIKRYIVVSHYTVGSNDECPSNNFPLEAILAAQGYVMIFPDYDGYGVAADRTHPYLVMEQCGYNVLQMYTAVRRLLEKTKYAPKYDDIYLMGYSQGGATTMAVESIIEMYSTNIKVRGVLAGGGPYDIKATYRSFVESNHCGYPYALPVVLQGMITGNDLNIDIKNLLQPWIAEKYDEWFGSKKYTSSQVNKFIGTHVTSEILSPMAMRQNSHEIAEIYKAMTQNSVTSFAWTPKAPVYLFHSIDDDTVPFVNAVSAREKWKDANVQTNFGHYGSHVMAALRFILSAKTYFENDQREERENMEN